MVNYCDTLFYVSHAKERATISACVCGKRGKAKWFDM